MAKGFCLGVDVGGTSAKLALVAMDGTVLMRRRLATGSGLCFDGFVSMLVGEVQTLGSEAERLGGTLDGVALGIPGLVSLSGRPHAVVNLPFLSDRDLAGVLGQALNIPVCVLNDATAAAYGEFSHGAGRGFSSLLLMTLGTGIGGGLVLDGRLWLGADGMAGEVGHLTVEPDGRPCPCGNAGCLEQYASATAIGEAWRRAAGVSTAADAAATDAATAAHRRDPRALAIFADAGRYLGVAVAGIANLLNLEAIILGGGLAGSLDLMRESLEREVARRAFPLIVRRLSIVPGALGDDAGTVGAVAYMRALAQHDKGEVS